MERSTQAGGPSEGLFPVVPAYPRQKRTLGQLHGLRSIRIPQSQVAVVRAIGGGTVANTTRITAHRGGASPRPPRSPPATSRDPLEHIRGLRFAWVSNAHTGDPHYRLRAPPTGVHRRRTSGRKVPRRARTPVDRHQEQLCIYTP